MRLPVWLYDPNIGFQETIHRSDALTLSAAQKAMSQKFYLSSSLSLAHFWKDDVSMSNLVFLSNTKPVMSAVMCFLMHLPSIARPFISAVTGVSNHHLWRCSPHPHRSTLEVQTCLAKRTFASTRLMHNPHYAVMQDTAICIPNG